MERARVMKSKLMRLLAVIFVILPMCLTNANANNDDFTFAGFVDDFGQNSIVINDTEFQIASNIEIYSTSGLSLAFSDINLGDKVGCEFQRISGNKFLLTKLHVLSANYDLNKDNKNSRAVLFLK